MFGNTPCRDMVSPQCELSCDYSDDRLRDVLLLTLHVNGLSPNVTLQVVSFRLSVCHIPDTDMVSPKCGYL